MIEVKLKAHFTKNEILIPSIEKELDRKNWKLELENDDLKEKIQSLKEELKQEKLDVQDLKDSLVNLKIEFSRKESNVNDYHNFNFY